MPTAPWLAVIGVSSVIELAVPELTYEVEERRPPFCAKKVSNGGGFLSTRNESSVETQAV
jgi:hypothetical protein